MSEEVTTDVVEMTTEERKLSDHKWGHGDELGIDEKRVSSLIEKMGDGSTVVQVDNKGNVLPVVGNHLLEVATDVSRANHPGGSMKADIERERREGIAMRELRKDMEISKQITAQIVAEKEYKDRLAAKTGEMLGRAVARSEDSRVIFLSVEGETPVEAARRAVEIKAAYPSCEVEPIDTSEALKNVQPLTEAYIEALKPIMHVTQPVNSDDLPDEIVFAIPNKPCDSSDGKFMTPEGHPEIKCFMMPPEDVKYETARYMHVESMPEELQKVVRTYIYARRGKLDGWEAQNIKMCNFKNAVVALLDQLDVVVDDDGDVRKEKEQKPMPSASLEEILQLIRPEE